MLSDLFKPYLWGKKGKEREVTIAKRNFYGENLDRALIDIEHGRGTLAARLANIDLDVSLGRISSYDGDIAKLNISSESDPTSQEYQIKRLEIDLNHKKITNQEYDKQLATINDEPYIAIVDVFVSPTSPQTTFFDFEWNDKHINNLREHGYEGVSDEEVNQRWFDDLCANAAREQGAIFPDRMEEFDHKKPQTVSRKRKK
jgi:adenylate kinase family enzyme